MRVAVKAYYVCMRGATMLYSIPELSKMYGIPTTTIHYWIKTGKLKADDEIRDNKLIKLVDEDDLKAYAATKSYNKVEDNFEASLNDSSSDELSLPIEHFQAMSLTMMNNMDRFQNLYDRLIISESEAASLKTQNDMLKEQRDSLTMEVAALREKLEQLQQGLIRVGPLKFLNKTKAV